MTDSLGLTWWDWFKLWKGRHKMLKKLGSRKLWATIAGVALVALGDQLGLDRDVTLKISGIIAAYILGQAHVDANTPPR